MCLQCVLSVGEFLDVSIRVHCGVVCIYVCVCDLCLVFICV